jgi:hypothetical protein
VNATAPGTLSVKDMATHLGCSTDIVYAGCRASGADRWPHMRVGTGIRAPIKFNAADRDEIERILHRAAQCPAVPEQTAPAMPSIAQIGRTLARRAPGSVYGASSTAAESRGTSSARDYT